MSDAGFKRHVGQSSTPQSRVIMLWAIGALIGAGLLYLALPLLAVAGLFILRSIGVVVLVCIFLRVLMFLIFLGTYWVSRS